MVTASGAQQKRSVSSLGVDSGGDPPKNDASNDVDDLESGNCLYQKNADVTLELVKKKKRSVGDKDGSAICAKIDEVNLLSFISFSWIFSFLWSAYRGRVDDHIKWTCSVFDSANVNMTRLEHLWNEEQRLHYDSPSLFRAILRFMKARLICACIIFLLCLIFGFIGPTCIIRGLISFTEHPPMEDGSVVYTTGIYLILSIFLVEASRVLMYGATWAVSYRTGIRVRGAVLALLYKNLVDSKSLRDKTPAEVVNIYANDGQRIFDAVTFAPLVLVGPFVLVGGMFYLLKVIGLPSLLGILVFLFFDAFQAFLGITMVRCRGLAIKKTEERMNLMGEIIKCIRVIKMNSWEDLFINRVIEIRKGETRYLKIAGYAQSLAVASGSIVPVVATFVTVISVVLAGNDLKASDAFSAITVFFVMLFGIRMIPYGTRYLAESRSAIKRIEELLLFAKHDFVSPSAQQPMDPQVAIQIKSAHFKWDSIPEKAAASDSSANSTEKMESAHLPNGHASESVPLNSGENELIQAEAVEEKPKFSLSVKNLVIKKKELIGVCGMIGSGKTALLNAILGHMDQDDGELAVGGTLAFVSQSAFVMNGTVRSNILFGQPMNAQRYYKAISCAQLTKDLEQMPANEMSEIGEHGATLSGGQKTRIAIARAFYSNRDVYLFDDIFASIDRSVADRIFEEGVKDLLVNRTVLLVTSNADYLKHCNRVLFFDEGQVVGFDSHQRLYEDNNLYQKFFIRKTAKEQSSPPAALEATKVEDPSTLDDSFIEQAVLNAVGRCDTEVEADHKNGDVPHRSAVVLNGKSATVTNGQVKPSSAVVLVDEAEAKQKLVEDEEDYGLANISRQIYLEYINAAGGVLVWCLVIVCFVLNVGSAVFSTYWLSKWMKDVHNDTRTTLLYGEGMAFNGGGDDGSARPTTTVPPVRLTSATSTSTTEPHYYESLAQNENLTFYATVYAISIVALFATGLFKAMIFIRVSLCASTNLHNRMLSNVIHAVTRFFDVTPSGRILNRFSKDLDEIDVKLPFSAEAMLQCMIMCLAFLAMIAWVFPAFLLTCLPLFVVFMLFFLCFRAGIRCLKRTENISRSPLFEHVNFSLDGLTTIHAYGQTQRYVDTLKVHLDENSGAMFMFQSAMRWQAVWLDLLVVAVTVLVSMMTVFLVNTVSPSEAGMAIAFAMQMSGVFQFAVRSQTELESKLTAVERVSYYYKSVDQEVDVINEPPALPANWPSTGEIRFSDVVLRYHPDSEPALRCVTLAVQHREKIGIVGRTGSGKSSLCSALFRMYPLESGAIYVDGWDISRLRLARVRRAMAIIPQDPVLFSGTLRFNIDPLGEFEDAEIWECLSAADVRGTVAGLASRLEFNVEQGGRNLSAGQRQLVCMARALLRKVKIVVLDEATASMDLQTDAQLQRAISQTFADRTVLLVTHRLNNIDNMDKLFHVKDGQVTIRELKSIKDKKMEENGKVDSSKPPDVPADTSTRSHADSSGTNVKSPESP